MSKELEALQRIKKFYPTWRLSNREAFNLVESALKALEIIKRKNIILEYMKKTNTVEQYNAGVFGTIVEPLTQEEYNILKEVLL